MKDSKVLPKRRAQMWAQQILQSIQKQCGKRTIPFKLMNGNEFATFSKAEITRAGQEVNLAIRWHNIHEERRREETRERQINEAKKSASGTVYTPDYKPEIIPWRVRGVRVEGKDLWHLEIAYGQLKRAPKPTRLGMLAQQLSLEQTPLIQQTPRQDPFDKWLTGGTTT